MEEKIKAIQNLIAKNELEKAIDALVLLTSGLPYQKEALLASRRYFKIVEKARIGTISDDMENTEEAKLTIDILDLLVLIQNNQKKGSTSTEKPTDLIGEILGDAVTVIGEQKIKTTSNPSKFSKLSYKELLLYSPYDFEYNYKSKGLKETDFEENVFVEIQKFLDAEQNLKDAIDPRSNNYHPIYILSGYSGNGKTTFTRWFKKRIEQENYFFEIINLTSTTRTFGKQQNLIKTHIGNRLERQLRRSVALPFIVYHSASFIDFFNERGDNGENIWNSLVALNKKQLEAKWPTKEKDINDFVKNLPFVQTLFMYLFECIFFLKNKGYTNHIFCFDNLDELRNEYLTDQLWADFLDVREQLIVICQDDDLDIHFDFDGKIVFLLVCREANLAITPAHTFDRLFPKMNKERFLLTSSGSKIISRRVRIADDYLSERSKKGTLNALVKIINKENYTNTVYLPLFNFDYRKLFQALTKLSESKQKEGKSVSIVNVDLEEYNNIASTVKNGARSIIFNGLIKYLIQNNFLKNFATNHFNKKIGGTDKGYCRESRLILTVVANMSYPNGFPHNKKRLLQIKPTRVGLYDLYKVLAVIYPDPRILFHWLSNYFVVSKASWAHLITIYNKGGTYDANNAFNGFDFTDEIKKIERINAKKSDGRESLIIENELNKITVQLNASGYIYLRYLIVHFEYFSALEASDSPSKNYKPLFQMTGFNPNNCTYEFEKVIDNVYEVVANYKKSMDMYFEHTLEELGFSVDTYCRSKFTFSTIKEPLKNLYASRIITTHISYIDYFRYFLLHNEKFKKQVEENKSVKPNSMGLVEINRHLVNYIEKYVTLLTTGIIDPTMKNNTESFLECIKRIKTANYIGWHPIKSKKENEEEEPQV